MSIRSRVNARARAARACRRKVGGRYVLNPCQKLLIRTAVPSPVLSDTGINVIPPTRNASHRQVTGERKREKERGCAPCTQRNDAADGVGFELRKVREQRSVKEGECVRRVKMGSIRQDDGEVGRRTKKRKGDESRGWVGRAIGFMRS